MKFTVIVNTYPRPDRELDLFRCLKSLSQQTYKNFDVLIVENASSDNSINYVLKKSKFVSNRVRVIVDSKKRLSYLFNLGWKNAKSSMLAYLADDAVAERSWLYSIQKELSSSASIGVVSGPVISTCFPAGEMHRLYLETRKNLFLRLLAWPYLHFTMEDSVLSPGKLFKSGAYSIGSGLQESTTYVRQVIDLATTTSMGIKRSVLEDVGGFDEVFNFNHADGDLFIRIIKKGYSIIFNPNVIAYHYVRLGPSRNSYFIGKDTGLFYKKDIKIPRSLKGFIGYVLNIMVLNLYWVYSFMKTKNLNQLKGISGFIEGYFS